MRLCLGEAAYMRINTNVSALIANNSLQKSQDKLSASIKRLSSGYKLNKSSDDPAGMAITEKMRLQIRGLKQSSNNSADGTSVLNTAEGGLIEVQDMLTRLKELSVQAANDVNSVDERQAIQDEIKTINAEIDRIAKDTEFNTQPLLDGNLSRRVFSNVEGVKQISVSDGFVAGNYPLTVTQDPRQAIVKGSGSVAMTAGSKVSKDQAGTISLNGYKVDIEEGDDLSQVMSKLSDGMSKAGGRVFATSGSNDTKTNGTENAGYEPSANVSGNSLIFMTDNFGSHEEVTISCDNDKLASLLGIENTAVDGGYTAKGSDVKVDFKTGSDGSREGFEDTAIITTDGNRVTVTDVNDKTFVFDLPANTAGTSFDDSGEEAVATNQSSKEIIEELTDVGTMSIHIGANEGQNVIINLPEVTTYTLGTDRMNVLTSAGAQHAISIVDKAIAWANNVRSKIGAYQNRFEHTDSNLAVSTENLTSAVSTMADTDMAEEMTEYTTMNVLTQAATSILSQANERPQSVLQLLQ